MKLKLLDTVVLRKNLPEHGIKTGDVGVVVEIYQHHAVEVEFVTGSGKTQALLTLNMEDVRPVSGNDILSVRSLNAA